MAPTLRLILLVLLRSGTARRCAALLLAAGLGGAAMAGPVLAAGGPAPATVGVEMTNRDDGAQVMQLDRDQVASGRVRFEVENKSADMVHEFLLVKTDLKPEQFPMNKAGSRVDEKKLKGVKELGDLTPGKSGVLTVDLRRGHYVLFCNEAGHFKGGMYAELTVTP